MSKRFIKILAILALIGISFNLYNVSFNGHIHTFQNSHAIIYHAHPTDHNHRTTTTDHSHHKLELLFLDQVIHLVELALFVVFLFFYILHISIHFIKYFHWHVANWRNRSGQMRAPPRLALVN